MLKKLFVIGLICGTGFVATLAAPTIGGPTISAPPPGTNSSGGIVYDATFTNIVRSLAGGGTVVSNFVANTVAFNDIKVNDSGFLLHVSVPVRAWLPASQSADAYQGAWLRLDSPPFDSNYTNISSLLVFGNAAGSTNSGTISGFIPAGWTWQVEKVNNVNGNVIVEPLADAGVEYTYFSTNGASGGSGSGGSATNVSGGTFSNVTLTVNSSVPFATTAGTATNTPSIAIKRFNGLTLGGYPNITNAVLNATAGDTVIVGPGSYQIPTNYTLIKSNVNYDFSPGVYLWQTNNGVGLTMWDWTAMGANPSTNIISGRPECYWYQGAVSNSGLAMLLKTNVNQKVIADFGYLHGESYATAGIEPYLISVLDGDVDDIRFTKMDCDNKTDSGNVMSGIYWSGGDLHIRGWSEIGSFPLYAIWSDARPVSRTNSLWAEGGVLKGYVYTTGSTNFKSWFICNEVLRNDSIGTVAGAFGFYGGRNYVITGKINNTGNSGPIDSAIVATGGGEGWIYTQKAERSGLTTTFVQVDADSKIDFQCPDLVDTTTNLTPMIVNKGTLILRDVKYKGAAPLLSVSRDTATTFTDVGGVSADTSQSVYPAVILADTNVVLFGNDFVSASTTNPIVQMGTSTNKAVIPSTFFCSLVKTNFDLNVALTGGTARTVTNWSYVVSSPGFTVNAPFGRITNSLAGYYRVFGSLIVSASSSTSGLYNLRYFKNGVADQLFTVNSGDYILSTDIAVIAEQKKLVIETTVFLPAGSTSDLRLECDTTLTSDATWSGFFTVQKL